MLHRRTASPLSITSIHFLFLLSPLSPLCAAWINNCVGHFNHRYFVLFMAYLWIGCLYVCYVSYSVFWRRQAWRHQVTGDADTAQFKEIAMLHSQVYGLEMTFYLFFLCLQRRRCSIDNVVIAPFLLLRPPTVHRTTHFARALSAHHTSPHHASPLSSSPLTPPPFHPTLSSQPSTTGLSTLSH